MFLKQLSALLLLGLKSVDAGGAHRVSINLPPTTQRDSSWDGGPVCRTSDCAKVANSILSMMDTSVSPCQDFYQYACGGFEFQQNSLPTVAGESRQVVPSIIGNMTNTIQKQLRNLLERQPQTVESTSRQKLRRFYKSCTDLASIERNSVVRMREIVSKMGGLLLRNGEDVSPTWSINNALALHDIFSQRTGLFSATVRPDEKNVAQNIIALEQGSLLLGTYSRDYYLNKIVTQDRVLIALTDLFEKFAKLILGGVGSINRSLIVGVIEFDKKRAEIQQTQAELQDRLATYNKVNVGWLQNNLPFLNWTLYFNDMLRQVNLGVGGNEQINLFGIPYFTKLTTLTQEYLSRKPGGRRVLQNYFIFHAILAYAVDIGGAFQAACEDFKAVFSGTSGSQERWKLCLDDADSKIGFPLGAMFVENYFPRDAKSRAETVVNEVISTFRNRLGKVGWMDQVTRVRALDKLDALRRKVGYPDWLFNGAVMDDRYSKLTITDDYIQNKFAMFNYTIYRELTKLRQTPDISEWLLNPQEVNAYYKAILNEIVIPAGILTENFFYAADGVSPALNFGASGGVIGHEITHGFDNNGRKYDKFGNLRQWWESVTDRQFSNRSVCFINKFNAYRFDGLAVNGEQTLAENIADDGGVKVAYEAYKNFESKNRGAIRKLVGLENFTHDQLFFIGYAQTWCNVDTAEWRRFVLLTDSHSPDRLRATAPLSNFQEFSTAFKCPPRTPMNVENKCIIW